ncbi:PPE family protein, SVP subgroup [Mycobacterium marinum]|uniref:PPE family protein, SVP subgroup n=1 Tax=Mycobacterium marinum TaxID=1781 RepID=UPI003B8A74A0
MSHHKDSSDDPPQRPLHAAYPLTPPHGTQPRPGSCVHRRLAISIEANPAPATSAVAANLPSSLSSVGSLDSGTAGMPFMPLTGMAGRSANGPAASRFELRSTVVPRSPAAG